MSSLKTKSLEKIAEILPADLYPELIETLLNKLESTEQEKIYLNMRDKLYSGENRLQMVYDYLVINIGNLNEHNKWYILDRIYEYIDKLWFYDDEGKKFNCIEIVWLGNEKKVYKVNNKYKKHYELQKIKNILLEKIHISVLSISIVFKFTDNENHHHILQKINNIISEKTELLDNLFFDYFLSEYCFDTDEGRKWALVCSYY